MLIAIIVLGPKRMQEAGRTIGRWMIWVNTSEFGQLLRNAVISISNLPAKLMSDANREIWEEEMKLQKILDPSTKKFPTTTYKTPTQKHQPPHKPNRKTSAAHAVAEKSEIPAAKKKDA
ncbi:MAG: hypothetical protein IT314_17610 [Anaerolineales bacterium]|nr:hypothetical protein [Anaerolineales bacterium]